MLHSPVDEVDARKKISWLERQPAVLDGRIRPIILMDAGDKGLRGQAIRQGGNTEFLSAWGAEMLRVHLNNIEISELDNREMRNSILEVTGGIPSDVIKLVAELAKSDDLDRVFEGWTGPQLDVSDYLDSTLVKALVNLEDVNGKEDFQVLSQIMRDAVGADLITLGCQRRSKIRPLGRSKSRPVCGVRLGACGHQSASTFQGALAVRPIVQLSG